MKRKKEKRLSLKIETLRMLDQLAGDDLGQVVGGAARKSVQCQTGNCGSPYA